MKNRIQSLAVCLVAIACLFVCAVRMHAQATTASIRGTVTDPTGAYTTTHFIFFGITNPVSDTEGTSVSSKTMPCLSPFHLPVAPAD